MSINLKHNKMNRVEDYTLRSVWMTVTENPDWSTSAHYPYDGSGWSTYNRNISRQRTQAHERSFYSERFTSGFISWVDVLLLLLKPFCLWFGQKIKLPCNLISKKGEMSRNLVLNLTVQIWKTGSFYRLLSWKHSYLVSFHL